MIGGNETNESKRKVRTDRYMLQIDVHKRFCDPQRENMVEYVM